MRRSSFIPSMLILLASGCPGTDPGTGNETGTTSTGPDTGSTTMSVTATVSDSTGPVDTGSTSPDGTATDASTGSTGEDTETTGDMGEFDCAMLPMSPISSMPIDGPRGYHGLVITPDGRMIGSDGTSLIASTYEGDTQVFWPGAGYGEQMDWLPNGDFAYATDDGAITRVRLDGTTDVIRPAVYAYGVILGADDMIYAVPNFDQNAVLRIDPISGDSTTIITGNQDQFHSIEFSPDNQRLYIGTIGFNDTVHYVDLDQDMNPTSGLEVLSDQVGGGGGDCWHDGIAVDACGNLYVTDYVSSDIYRVTPSGETTTYWVAPSFEAYGHGVVWGTGEHGWRDDAIYIPQPYNGHTVAEIVIGGPSRDFGGTVLNPPPML